MPNTWERALKSYFYPVNLLDFEDANSYPNWFKFDLRNGDRINTIEFESHFRNQASEAFEPWLEVIFWKLYSQPRVRNKITRQVAQHSSEKKFPEKSLWKACTLYVRSPSRSNFDLFRNLFGFISRAIAVAATFPAFIDPISYPMVDTRIAKWVGNCMDSHNAVDRNGPQLLRAPFLDSSGTVLTMTDYEFMESWTRWCKYTASKLTKQTSINWRARDVEMAVFHAWGGRCDNHPMIHLNPLTRI